MAQYGFSQSQPKSTNSEMLLPLSEIKYATPKKVSFLYKHDMAICFVFFNPAKSCRLLMNYLYTVEKMRNAKIPWFTLELTYGDELPEIKKAFHIQTRNENVMFHKEQLCHLLEKRVPWQYTKLLFLDADVIFEDVEFFDNVSKLLDDYDIVQPFRNAKWLDATFKNVIQERKSAALMNRKAPFDSLNYHPGFAWAFRRSWFQKIGFFQYSITGSGDSLSVAAWLQISPPKVCLIKAVKKEFEKFFLRVKQNPPRISCSEHSVFHLWHGTHKKRQYVNRHLILRNVDDVKDIVEKSANGLFDFNYGRDHNDCILVTRISEELKAYFVEREDDEV
jgi:hypothetical protein